MPVEIPPPPPGIEQPKQKTDAPIMDMREKFARKTPQSADDEARTREFIEGKVGMIRSDPAMTDAEKDAAIAELRAKR